MVWWWLRLQIESRAAWICLTTDNVYILIVVSICGFETPWTSDTFCRLPFIVMRLALLLLVSTALTCIANCSARAIDTSSNQRLRQRVDDVDVRSEGNVEKRQKLQRRLNAESEKEEDEDNVSKDERSGVPLPGELGALTQSAAETNGRTRQKTLQELFAKDDMNTDMESIAKLQNFVKANELESLQHLYRK